MDKRVDRWVDRWIPGLDLNLGAPWITRSKVPILSLFPTPVLDKGLNSMDAQMPASNCVTSPKEWLHSEAIVTSPCSPHHPQRASEARNYSHG